MTSRSFYPGKTIAVYIAKEAGWAPQAVWTVWRREKFAVGGFKRRNIQTVAQSIHRLHYLGSLLNWVCLFMAQQPPVGQVLFIHEVSRSHTKTHHSRWDSSGRVISPSQRPLPDDIQLSQQTDNHAPGGIRIHILSRRAAEDLRFRPRGHRDRHLIGYRVLKLYLQRQADILSLHGDRKLLKKKVSVRLWRFTWYKIK